MTREIAPLVIEMAPAVLIDLPTENNRVTFIPDTDHLYELLQPDVYEVEGPHINGIVVVKFERDSASADEMVARVKAAIDNVRHV